MVAQFDARCLQLATEAAAKGGKISEQDVLAAFERVRAYKESLEASGQPTGSEARLRRFAAEEAEKARIAAALKRRHTALNILVREKQLSALRDQVRQGRTRYQALVAALTGTQAGVRYGRSSFVNNEAAFIRKYVTGGLAKDIRIERPHVERLMHDKAFDEAVTREMAELKKDGKPGITGNEDAKWVAKKLADYGELARTDANERGASIGKLDGRMGPQVRDPLKMLKDSPDVWATRELARLDTARTFPDAPSELEAHAILKDIYFHIVTGFSPNRVTAAQKGERVNPANLAKTLGKSRVLHYKSVDDALAAREEYGYGNTIEGVIAELRHMAHVNAAMDSFGPNPEIMVNALADQLKRDIAEDPTLSPQERAKQTNELNDGLGSIKYGIDTMTNASVTKGNITLAKIGSEIRALEIFGKLGSMLFAQVGDTVTPGISAAFRGGANPLNPLKAWTHQLGAVFRGRTKDDVEETAYLWGEGLDGMIGSIVNAHVADDMRLGWLSRQTHTFFKWVGATWLTDNQRAAAARYIVAEMGLRGAKAWADLPPAYSHWLGLHGVDAPRWEAIRAARTQLSNGKFYITPDAINELPDNLIEPLVADRVARARAANRDAAPILADARDDLVMQVSRMIADEVNYAVLQSDASTRRFTTLGLRPGTAAGEAIRSIFQFKGFPAAFTQRVLGRAFYGRRKGAGAGETATHFGTLLVGLAVAGYLAMTLKDIGKGYWPPRDPGDMRTWMAAMMQGGALGLYGDFLFAQADRFGRSPTQDFVGPAFGTIGDFITLGQDAIGVVSSGGEDQFSQARFFNTLMGHNPIWPANLWYTRPALDWLILNTMRESFSPGYLRRQRRNRERDFGQSRIPFLPQTAF